MTSTSLNLGGRSKIIIPLVSFGVFSCVFLLLLPSDLPSHLGLASQSPTQIGSGTWDVYARSEWVPHIREEEGSAKPIDDFHSFDWPSIETLLVFGDSLSDYSKDYADLIEGRKSNLALSELIGLRFKWVDWLHLFYRDPQKTNYWNYGHGGAVIDRNVLPPYNEEWPDFSEEIRSFEQGHPKGSWDGTKSLVIILFGNNDMKQLARIGNRVDDEIMIESLVSSLFRSAAYIHGLGARNFLFLSPPPIDLMPPTHLPSRPGYQDRFITGNNSIILNRMLEAQVDQFQRLEGVKAIWFDTDAWMRRVREYPILLGLIEEDRYRMIVEGVEQTPGRMGFFWQDQEGHPSGHIARLLADAVNGILLRHSTIMQRSTASEIALEW